MHASYGHIRPAAGMCDGPYPPPGCVGPVTLPSPSPALLPTGTGAGPVVVPAPERTASSWVWTAVRAVSVGASAYHGTRRNDSVGWGVTWGLLGWFAPVITPAVAVAQGFGQRKR